MRVIIAGSRDYINYAQAKQCIDDDLKDINGEITVLSGGCRGADKLGERYATEHHFAIETYLPDWKRYGKAAGPQRNRKMVDSCDSIICFWDGKSSGTKSLLSYAKKHEKPIHLHIVSLSPKK